MSWEPQLPPRFPLTLGDRRGDVARLGAGDVGEQLAELAGRVDALEAADNLYANPLILNSDGTVSQPTPPAPVLPAPPGDTFTTNDIENWVLVSGTPAATITPGVGFVFYDGSAVEEYIGTTAFVNGAVTIRVKDPVTGSIGGIGAAIAIIGFGVANAINAGYLGHVGLIISINGVTLAAKASIDGGNGLQIVKRGNLITAFPLLNGTPIDSLSLTLTGANATLLGAGVAGHGGCGCNGAVVTSYAETHS